ncbi:magnesium transporter, partial [bacterium]|nr:magnesium transporter [bacterium]
MLGKLLGPDIQEMLFEKRLRELRGALSELPPPDVAELLSDMAENDRAIVFRILPRALASETFEHLSVDDQQSLLAGFNQEQCRRIIQEMDPDDRTALLEELPARVTRKLLRLLSPEDRRITQALLAYPEDSVGRLMTPDYIELRAEMTVSQAIDHIRRVGMTKETVYECYVTLPGHKLEGTIDLKTLVLSQPDAGIKDLMKSPPVAAVNPQQDQEEAALLLQTYDLLALPVIDAERRLIGIITVDDLMDVMAEAADEDIQVMAGVVPETESTYLRQRLLSISWRRGLPMLGLVVVEFIAGLVMRGHHARLQSVLALAYFVPMVMATGGGMG